MSIYKKKHIENMRLFYLVAMETDHDSYISCCLDAKIAMFLHILRCKLEKSTDWPYFFMETFLKYFLRWVRCKKNLDISYRFWDIAVQSLNPSSRKMTKTPNITHF